ncbi:unnamed protein product [Nippostrongylus brasiliensis]|uniref:Uncharacterized protein n=1 Tax=Nippostrongylus brasiliensis TaxID=27835 RepID=A0A0N4YIB1_NIPBR|nr:unnamed protein product [Nippostrongylus brasiliensis]
MATSTAQISNFSCLPANYASKHSNRLPSPIADMVVVDDVVFAAKVVLDEEEDRNYLILITPVHHHGQQRLEAFLGDDVIPSSSRGTTWTDGTAQLYPSQAVKNKYLTSSFRSTMRRGGHMGGIFFEEMRINSQQKVKSEAAYRISSLKPSTGQPKIASKLKIEAKLKRYSLINLPKLRHALFFHSES